MAFADSIKRWAYARDAEAARKNTIAGGKYPHLCTYADELYEAVGVDHLKIVHIDRPLAQSEESLIRREGSRHPHKQLRLLQRKLWKDKLAFLRRRSSLPILTIGYDDLLRDPTKEVSRLVEFLLPFEPDTSAIEAAIASVDPSKRHIKG